MHESSPKKRPESFVHLAGGFIEGHGEVIGPVASVVSLTTYAPCKSNINWALILFPRVPLPPHGELSANSRAVHGLVSGMPCKAAITVQFVRLVIML